VEPVDNDELLRDVYFDSDINSIEIEPVSLADHLKQTAAEARRLCEKLNEKTHPETILTAAQWHDTGKAHPVFQETMHACDKAPPGLLAKSPCSASHSRRYFRHELASLLGWLQNCPKDKQEDMDLVAFLIAAHHGKVRLSLRALPDEPEAPDGKRYARGIWEGDALPGFSMDGVELPATALKLNIMELGETAMGPSWTTRTQRLLAEHGPFLLSWLESLVRIADWRASAKQEASDAREV